MSPDDPDERSADADASGTDAAERQSGESDAWPVEADASGAGDAGDDAGGGENASPDTTDTEDITMTDTETDTTESTSERVRRALNYLLLAGLAIFALVAAVGFYTASTSVISTWVTHEYRPLVRAAFNLVVLLVVGAAIVRQTRRLS